MTINFFKLFLKINRFKIQIPIIVSAVNSPYTLFCFFLSTIIGHSFLMLRKIYRKYFKLNAEVIQMNIFKKGVQFLSEIKHLVWFVLMTSFQNSFEQQSFNRIFKLECQANKLFWIKHRLFVTIIFACLFIMNNF